MSFGVDIGGRAIGHDGHEADVFAVGEGDHLLGNPNHGSLLGVLGDIGFGEAGDVEFVEFKEVIGRDEAGGDVLFGRNKEGAHGRAYFGRAKLGQDFVF